MVNNQQQESIKEKHPGYWWVAIALIVITQELSLLVINGMGVLLPAFRLDLNFDLTEAGLLRSLAQLPYIISVPASLIITRFRPKWSYFVILVLIAASGFLIALSSSFIFLAIGHLILGLFIAVRQIPDTVLRLQWIPVKIRATVFGITTALMALSQSIAVMIIPFMLLLVGTWQNTFIVYGFIMILLAIIWMIFGREHSPVVLQNAEPSTTTQHPSRSILKRKEFILLGIGIFGNGLTYMCHLLFLPTYLIEQKGVDLTTAGLISSFLPLGGVCANFVMGIISDKIGLRKPTIWPAALLQPIAYYILVNFTPLSALPAVSFITGFLAWAPFAAIHSIPFELPGVKPSEVAIGYSMTTTIQFMGFIIGLPIVGYLVTVLGSLSSALSVVCVFPLTMAIVGFLLPETGWKAKQKEKDSVHKT